MSKVIHFRFYSKMAEFLFGSNRNFVH